MAMKASNTTVYTADNPPAVMPSPKPAKFAGKCPGCNARIALDEPIVWVRGMGTRCRDCCVGIWGSQARAHFGMGAEVPIELGHIDPIDRPIVPNEKGQIDFRPRRVKAPNVAQPKEGRAMRTYEELFPDDD